MSGLSLRGLLFDKDGTLFDFEQTWSEVTRQMIDRLGRSAPERRMLAETVGYDHTTGAFTPGSPIVAGAVGEVCRIWSAVRDDLSAGEIERHTNVIVADAVTNGALVPAAPDLGLLLDRLIGMGHVLGVATHDSEAGACQQLAEVGVLDRFAFVAGYDSGHGLKPDPGMLMAFAGACGLTPGEIMMIGDSPGDLQMARRAAAGPAVAVLTGPATRAELAPHADHVIASIADLPAVLTGLRVPGHRA